MTSVTPGFVISQCLKCWGVIGLTVALAQAQGVAPSLPRMGDGVDLSYAQERQIGQGVMMQVLRMPTLETDAELNDYVRSIWHRLRQAALKIGTLSPEQSQAFTWQVSLLRDTNFNAFALPGGYMGLNLGLMSAVENEGELAAVLAHELSHVTQRHIARRFDKSQRETPLILGAMLLGLLVAGQSGQGAQALIVGGQAAGMASALGFSREAEREADRVGLQVLMAAGYAPESMEGLFRQMAKASSLADTQSYPYLRSHPLTTEREADVMARIQQLPPQPQAPADLNFVMARARAKVLLTESIDLPPLIALVSSARAQAPLSERVGTAYTLALANLRLGQLQAAQAAWQQLEVLVPQAQVARLWVSNLQVALLLKQGQAQAAVDAFNLQAPSQLQRSQRLWLAQAQLASTKPEWVDQARQALELMSVKFPDDALIWDLLGQAWLSAGQRLRGLRALAEAEFARYNHQAALDRLQAALNEGDRLRAAGQLSAEGWADLGIIQARWRVMDEARQAWLKQRS